jgi:uncharacterized protein (TIGR02246 family)
MEGFAMADADVDVRAAHALRQALEAAENAADADAAAALFADDVVVMVPDYAVQEGKAASLRFMRDIMGSLAARFDRHIEYASAEVVLLGDTALDRGTFAFTVSPKSGGERSRVTGKYLWLLRRAPAGPWRVARLIVSRDEDANRDASEARGTAAAREGEPADRRRSVAAIGAAWLLALGFDVFLHAGLLAYLYTVPSPFLLDPAAAFRRIPLGYLAFLLLTAALYWLLTRLDVRGALAGYLHGAAAGAIVWGALVVGLYSISTAGMPLLTGWWIGQTIELGLSGAVLGAFLAGARPTRLWALVGAAVVAFVAATVVMQSLGWAPAMRVVQ